MTTNKIQRHAAQGAVERLNKQRNERELILGLLNTAFPLHTWIDYAGDKWQVHAVYLDQCEAYLSITKGYSVEKVPVASVLLDQFIRSKSNEKA